MATRWMKWNVGTHIFEYSTDGVTFNPLPLNASILNEGTIDPARLPAGMLSGSVDNIFTATNPITLESPAPTLDFTETDQGVDLKKSRIRVDSGVIGFQKMDDAYTTPVNLMRLNRSGQLTVTPSAPGPALDISGQVNPSIILNLRNIDPGNDRFTAVKLGNDTTDLAGQLTAHSSGFTPAGWVQSSGVLLTGTQVGGLHLAATHASGWVRLYTGGSVLPRLGVSPTGDVGIYGTITERNRTVPMGEWIDIPYAAGNFTATGMTWTVAAGDQLLYKYTIVGKTVTVIFHIQASSLAGTPTTTLFMALPAAIQALDQVRVPCQIYNGAGAWRTGCVGTSPSTPRLNITDINQTTTFAVSSDSTYVLGAITYNIA